MDTETSHLYLSRGSRMEGAHASGENQQGQRNCLQTGPRKVAKALQTLLVPREIRAPYLWSRCSTQIHRHGRRGKHRLSLASRVTFEGRAFVRALIACLLCLLACLDATSSPPLAGANVLGEERRLNTSDRPAMPSMLLGLRFRSGLKDFDVSPRLASPASVNFCSCFVEFRDFSGYNRPESVS
jgi:hypothetical protein